MHNWFECKISYDKTMENGVLKRVTEAYLVDALSVTEAEARIIEEMTPFISGEFKVSGVKQAKVAELFFNADGDSWYKAKVNFITLDEKSGTEKKTAVTMVVQATTIDEALAGVKKGMEGTMADYVISHIGLSNIWDVFPYNVKKAETKKDEKE